MIENEMAKLENQPILRLSSCAYPISCRRCVSALTPAAGVAGVFVATSRPPSDDESFRHYDTKADKKLASFVTNATFLLLGGDVRGGDAAVDDERGAGHERGVVGR